MRNDVAVAVGGNVIDAAGILNRSAGDVNVLVLNVTPFNAEKERCFLVDRAANGSVVLNAVIGGHRRQEWVAGVEETVISHPEGPSVQYIGSRFGENLDASVADMVEFGGKGILVDANLADGRLGRERAASEAVDVNLAAVRSGCRPSQRRQFVRQLIRIVRQRVQVLAFKNDGAGVAARLRL